MAQPKRGAGFARSSGGVRRGGGISRSPMPPTLQEMVEYTGDPEKDSVAECELTLEALQNKERKKALREKLRLTTDSEFWAALCFETRGQKDAFLQAVGVYDDGDKYIDGVAFARRLGIDLPKANIDYRPTARPNKRLSSLTKQD